MWKNFIKKIAARPKIIREHGKPIVTEEDGIKYVAAYQEIDKYHNRGVKYLEKKKYQKAIKQFEKEVDCEKGWGFMGYWFLGRTYRDMGERDKGKKFYETALRNAEELYKEDPKSIDKGLIKNIKEDSDSWKA